MAQVNDTTPGSSYEEQDFLFRNMVIDTNNFGLMTINVDYTFAKKIQQGASVSDCITEAEGHLMQHSFGKSGFVVTRASNALKDTYPVAAVVSLNYQLANYRSHDDTDLTSMVVSIKQQGVINPVDQSVWLADFFNSQSFFTVTFNKLSVYSNEDDWKTNQSKARVYFDATWNDKQMYNNTLYSLKAMNNAFFGFPYTSFPTLQHLQNLKTYIDDSISKGVPVRFGPAQNKSFTIGDDGKKVVSKAGFNFTILGRKVNGVNDAEPPDRFLDCTYYKLEYNWTDAVGSTPATGSCTIDQQFNFTANLGFPVRLILKG